MVNQMTRLQKRLTKQLKKKAEKYVRARCQSEYLQECISKQIIPRSINLVKLVKSAGLWEINAKQDTFDILFEASKKLVENQLKIKEGQYKNIDEEGKALRETLKQDIGDERF